VIVVKVDSLKLKIDEIVWKWCENNCLEKTVLLVWYRAGGVYDAIEGLVGAAYCGADAHIPQDPSKMNPLLPVLTLCLHRGPHE